MGLIIQSVNEVREHITRRLLDNWVAVLGNNKGITSMENSIYPPGTPKNADFELAGFPPFICLAKKTDELQQMYQLSDFDNLLALTFHNPVAPDVKEGYTGWLIESTLFNADAGESKVDAIGRLVSMLTQQWGD